jgi:hypothetical protein
VIGRDPTHAGPADAALAPETGTAGGFCTDSLLVDSVDRLAVAKGFDGHGYR